MVDIKKIQEQLDKGKKSTIGNISDHHVNKATANQISAQDPTWLEKNASKNKKMAKDPDWINKVKKSIKNKYATDPEYKKKKLEFIQSDSFNEKRKKGHKKYFDENKEEFAKIMSKARRSGKGMREVVTPYGEFKTVVDFHDHVYQLNKPKTDFYNKKKSIPHLYYYKDEGPGEPTYEKVFHSPYGKAGYNHRQRLIEKRAIQANDEVYLSYKCKNTWWGRMKYLHPEEYYETREIKKEWELID